MELLTFSQILFNFTFSVAAIVVAAVICMVAYYIITSIISVRLFLQNVGEKTSEALKKIEVWMATLVSIPLISKIFKRKKK